MRTIGEMWWLGDERYWEGEENNLSKVRDTEER
jgi:hypothetical protein